MRKLSLLIIVSISGFFSLAQSAYSDIKLEEKADFQLAEPFVLKASNYLFTSKYDKDDLERLYAIEFIMKWMGGTTDYSFEINEKYTQPFIHETDLLGLYMGAVAKYALEHKSQAKDVNAISLNAVKMVINYSSKQINNLKQTGELKKLATALKRGELEKYFGI